MKAAISAGILAVAGVAVAALWAVSSSLHLRSPASQTAGLLGLAAWGVVFCALVTSGLMLGRAWRTRAAPVQSAVPALLAIFLPIVAGILALSFQHPTWWPRWFDSEFAGVIAILAGGILGVFLFIASPVEGRSGRTGRWVLFAWSVIVLLGAPARCCFLSSIEGVGPNPRLQRTRAALWRQPVVGESSVSGGGRRAPLSRQPLGSVKILLGVAFLMPAGLSASSPTPRPTPHQEIVWIERPLPDSNALRNACPKTAPVPPIVDAHLRRDGRVDQVGIVRHGGCSAADQLVARHVRRWKFKPAQNQQELWLTLAVVIDGP
jgi:hypothetical protein